MTKTEEIFKTNGCPFNNHSQGQNLRVVFVCSAGMLRSPTAARVASDYGINARSAGSHFHYALIPLSANLIKWADFIVFMNSSNSLEVVQKLQDGELLEELKDKSIIWNIEDTYNYMEESLVWKIEREIEQTFDAVKLDSNLRST